VFDFDGKGTISRDELRAAVGVGARDDPFRVNLETIFGLPAEEIARRFTSYIEGNDNGFSIFFRLMQREYRRQRTLEEPASSAAPAGRQ